MPDPNVRSDASTAAPATAPSSEELLRAALERLVLLECRASTAPAENSGLGLEVERWRSEAQQAQRRAVAAEAQRDRLFAQLIEAERVRGSLSGEGGEVDLGSFIAELRSELGQLERERELADRQRLDLLAQLRQARVPHPPQSAVDWAERLSTAGVFKSADTELLGLEKELVVGTPAERALLGGLLRDLTQGEIPLREAACERLASLPQRLSAPILAAALSREGAAQVLAALLRAAGRCGLPSLQPLVSSHRHHADDRVRAAALLAEARLTKGTIDPTAFTDGSPRVRRAAALATTLWTSGSALASLEPLAADPNAGVRRLAAGCAAALREPSELLLKRLALDEQLAVRRAALRALGAPEEISELTASERRRALQETAKLERKKQPRQPVKAVPTPTAAASNPETAPASNTETRGILEAIELALRSSLRGRTLAELQEELGVENSLLVAGLEQGVGTGRFILRGPKYFVG